MGKRQKVIKVIANLYFKDTNTQNFYNKEKHVDCLVFRTATLKQNG